MCVQKIEKFNSISFGWRAFDYNYSLLRRSIVCGRVSLGAARSSLFTAKIVWKFRLPRKRMLIRRGVLKMCPPALGWNLFYDWNFPNDLSDMSVCHLRVPCAPCTTSTCSRIEHCFAFIFMSNVHTPSPSSTILDIGIRMRHGYIEDISIRSYGWRSTHRIYCQWKQ